MSKGLLQMIRAARRKAFLLLNRGEDGTEAKLQLNGLLLEGSHNIANMSETAGWKFLTDILLAELRNKMRTIYRLSSDPIVNQNKIMELRGTCEAITEILSTVNKWKDKQALLNNEFKELISRATNTQT